MLFKQRFHAGLRDGSIDMTVRRWSRAQVKPGGRYRTPIGSVEVDSLERVPLSEISDADARRSGFDDRDALLATLRGRGGSLTARTPVFRIGFHYAGPAPAAPDDRSSDALDVIEARLDRMDRASRHGAWTRPTLRLIARHPHTAASKLAPKLGRELRPFKADVRKLKRLGLTVSFDVGYEVSPVGKALLARS